MITTDHASAEPLTRRSGRRAALPMAAEVASSVVSSVVAPGFDASVLDASVLDASVSPRRAARAAREAAAAAQSSLVVPPVAAAPVVVPSVAAPAPSGTASAAPTPSGTAPAAPTPSGTAPAAPTPMGAASLPVTSTGSFVGLAASVPSSMTGRRQTFVSAPAAPRRRVVAQTAVRPVAAPVARSRRSAAFSTARRVGLLAVVCGIVATSILPSLGADQSRAFAAGTGTGASASASSTGSQQYDVSSAVTNSIGARDGYGATSVVDYEKTAISAREALGVTDYTGPSAADYLAKPLYDHLDRAEVFQVALQYLGTPYVHGGADPSAFDCSGLIMFVYAQFGISLPHYVPSQDAMGTTIPQSEAVPGDLVVFDNEAHDGIYAGNGMILDAPKPGGFVTVRPIWDQAHHFVRIAG